MDDIEPDDKDKNQREYKINNDFLTFKVDLKKEKFQHNYNRINSIFQGDYTKFVRSKKDENFKEIYIFLRKYQYFISSFMINSLDILNHNFEESFINNSENKLEILVDILPKFKRNEINFEIINDLLNIVIYLSINNKASDKNQSNLQVTNFQIEVINLKNEKFYSSLKESLTYLYYQHLENIGNIFKSLNKYLTYIENYFPVVLKQCFDSKSIKQEKRKEKEDSSLNWTQEEQDKLELGLVRYKEIKEKENKFNLISEFVGTKSAKACIERFKMLSQLTKEKKKEKTQIKTETIKNDSLNININKEQKVVTQKKEPEKKEIKIIYPDKDRPDFIKEENNLKEIKNEEMEGLSLVDQIMKEFQNTYLNPQPINSKKEKLEQETQEIYKRIIDEVNREQEIDDPNIKEGDFCDIDDENININVSSQNKNHLNQIISLIKTGDRTALKIYDALMLNCSLAKFTHLSLYAKCGKCKQIAFDAKFIRLNKGFDIFYSCCICPKCKNEIQMIFKADYLHLNNTIDGGVIFSKGVQILDYLPSNMLLYCLNCEDTMFKIKEIKSGMRKTDFCQTCQKRIEICFQSIKFDVIQYNDYSFLENFTVENFQKYTFTIEINDNSSFVPKYEKVGNPGSALPNNGTCKHYKNSCRWFRFPCCGKAFPCDECHDIASNHESTYAKQIICGFCSNEQGSNNKNCIKCAKNFLNEPGSLFWEGGKGCRDKSKMSNKDNHKFRGSNLKTISNKKKALLEKNNN